MRWAGGADRSGVTARIEPIKPKKELDDKPAPPHDPRLWLIQRCLIDIVEVLDLDSFRVPSGIACCRI
jgi:hypothetical protein